MTDFRLMRGEGWVRCCICGHLHTDPYPDLYVDPLGEMWDECRTCHQHSASYQARNDIHIFHEEFTGLVFFPAELPSWTPPWPPPASGSYVVYQCRQHWHVGTLWPEYADDDEWCERAPERLGISQRSIESTTFAEANALLVKWSAHEG